MRQALVDSSLLARRAAGRFIELFAELCDVVLVSTDEVDEDWIINQEGACENAELMAQSMLSVLPAGFTAEPRLRGWILSLKNTFPLMTDAANEYLRTTTGPLAALAS